MFVACQEHCYKFTSDTCEEIQVLTTSLEEVETRLLLHTKHAAQIHQSVVILSDDTDVFEICLSLCSSINCNIYLRHGTKSRVRMVNITQLATAL